MRIGTLAYATNQGLGLLAKDFYDHGILTDVLVVNHNVHPNYGREWYPDSEQIMVKPFDRQKAREFVSELDVFFFFETPFDWNLLPFCRFQGVKSVCMPMHECMPVDLPAHPDAYINPSLLDQQHFSGPFIPVPVDVPWRLRTKAEVFIHNAGHGGLKGRNGTDELLQAMEYVQSPLDLIIRSQADIEVGSEITADPRIRLCIGTVPTREELYAEGDVYVFPEKFNGLSLPLQEARASGMLIISTDRFPINTWLPQESLVPTCAYQEVQLSPRLLPIKEALVDPVDIAQTLDRWYGADISYYSKEGREWAETMSWDALKPIYLEELTK